MYWILRTGAPWRDLPEAYGPWQTVATRFYRWVRSGLVQRLLGELQRQADAAGDLEWDLHYVDGTVIRAHQHAAGAKKGGRPTTPQQKRSGGARAASAPRSTSAPRGVASR
jgi:transposase